MRSDQYVAGLDREALVLPRSVENPERVALLERERERRGRIDHVPRYALAQERVQPVRIPRGWVHLVIKDGPAGSAQLPVALDADHAFGVRRKPGMEDELAQID